MLGFDFGKAAECQHYSNCFEEISKIGHGGFSNVFKVRNKLDNHLYAIKTVKIKPSSYKYDLNEYFDKQINQAQILAQLKHPNIVSYYGCWIEAQLNEKQSVSSTQQENNSDIEFEMVVDDDSQNSGIVFMHESCASESYIQKEKSEQILKKDCLFGEEKIHQYKEITFYYQTQLGQQSLQSYIHRRNYASKQDKTLTGQCKIQNYQFILDIINGLKYIHQHNIIHRDLKLQNVIIDKNKRCKIIDFGLARKIKKSFQVDITNDQELVENEDEKLSSSIGTKMYSSPEQASTNKYDHRTDIYSLGMIIAILFSKWSTNHQETEMLMNIRKSKLSSKSMDKNLRQLVIKCLKEQEQRPTLEQLKICLKNLLRIEIINGLMNNNEQYSQEMKRRKLNVLSKWHPHKQISIKI